MTRTSIRWALRRKWKDHPEAHIVHEDFIPKLFVTRREARMYNEDRFGYIRHREDLKRPPHEWRMPQVIKVEISEMSNAGQTKAELIDEIMRLRQQVAQLESELASCRALVVGR